MAVTSSSRPTGYPPRLDSGDRLTRDEFERRYEAMPKLKKAELVEGVVYVGSPVSLEHANCHGALAGWLVAYAAPRTGVQMGDNATLRLDGDNEYQPDALLRRIDGTSRVSADGYIEGPPELVAEVAVSSVSIDLHTKLNVYRRSGVPEYIVWRVRDGAFDWFALEAGEYRPIAPDAAGVVESRVFPGLRMPVPELLAGDYAAVLRAVASDPTR